MPLWFASRQKIWNILSVEHEFKKRIVSMRLFCNYILRKNVLRALGYLKLCLELIIQIKFFAKSIFANSPYRRQLT